MEHTKREGFEIPREMKGMPEEMRAMVEREVMRQLEADGAQRGSRHASRTAAQTSANMPVRSLKKTIALAAAAVAVLGTTAFAGSRIYEFYAEKHGNYGVKTVAVMGTEKASAVDETATEEAQAVQGDTLSVKAADGTAMALAKGTGTDTQAVEVRFGWLPEGLVNNNDPGGKLTYSYEETPYQGGISVTGVRLDAGETFEMETKNVEESEEVTLGEHQAVYLRVAQIDDDQVALDKRIFVFYPEYSRVLLLFVGEDISREDALKIAEHISLEPTEGEDRVFGDWNAAAGSGEPEAAAGETNWKRSATAEEMKNTHLLDEAFTIKSIQEPLIVCVTDVQVADDLSLLDEEYMEADWLRVPDESGKLPTNTLQFIKAGDGIDTVDEVIKTQETAVKLLYVTVEYTNVGEETIDDVVYYGSMNSLVKTEDGYQLYDRTAEVEGCDYVRGTVAKAMFTEMDYSDLRGGERGNNHITNLAPGETTTVHIAKLVNEDELANLYLSLDPDGMFDEQISENALETGLVDIGQAIRGKA